MKEKIKKLFKRTKVQFKILWIKFKKEWSFGGIFSRATILLACMALMVCCVVGFNFVKEKLDKPATAKVSLTYQNASSGLNPNGTRFNPYYMVSDEVIAGAEEILGYEIDTNLIYVTFPQITNKNDYTTDFYMNAEGSDKDNLLKAMLTSWANLFEKNYTYSNDSVIYSEPSENMDYIYLVTWLTNETTEISSYAKSRMKQDNTFESNGTTFKNIYDNATNIIDVDIENFRTFIVQNGVSKDAESLINSIAYKDRLLSDKKTNYEAQYANRRTAIQLYDQTLFPTISVPSVSNGTYYITTTKTGLDYIYDAAASASSNSLDTQRMISDDEEIVQYMDTENGTSSENLKIAEEMYQNLKEEIAKLGEILQQVDNDYNSQQIEPYYSILINGDEWIPNVEGD